MTIRQTFDVPPLTATPAGGELLPIVGAPSDGDVATFVASANRWEPRATSGGGAPAGYAWMPLFSIVADIAQPVLDASSNVVLTLVPVP